MDIEPLRSILKHSLNKKNTLLFFLSDKIKQKVHHLDYEEKNFYLNDSILCIKKSTLEIDIKGKILFIEENILGIKISSIKTICINPNDFYIFVKNNKTVNTQRHFMKELLKQI